MNTIGRKTEKPRQVCTGRGLNRLGSLTRAAPIRGINLPESTPPCQYPTDSGPMWTDTASSLCRDFMPNLGDFDHRADGKNESVLPRIEHNALRLKIQSIVTRVTECKTTDRPTGMAVAQFLTFAICGD